MHPREVVPLPLLLHPRHHQIPHYHLLSEVVFQDGSEDGLVEQILVVSQVYAFLALYPSHYLYIFEFLLCSIEVLLQVGKKRCPEGLQEVFGWVAFPLLLAPLFVAALPPTADFKL